jgi:acyl dehydratase
MPEQIAEGTELPSLTQKVELTNSVQYAGASGDYNPLHYDPGFAGNVSPTGGVIAHGMYSMGLASRVLTSWAGGPEQVLAIDVRFTKPWPMGTAATFGGTVTGVEDGVATVRLWARRDEDEVAILKGTGRVRIDG